jgi:N-acetylated-alpha-linked acidic dipeptidase
MSRILVTLACAWLCLAADSGRQYRGYFNGSSDAEKSWEAKYRAIPQPANMREYMRRLSAKPHHVGSPYDKENAEWILANLKSWGLDARIETFDVLFPTPRQRIVELVEPRRFAAKLAEPPVPADPTSGQEGQLPVYHAYSRDGDVTAALVYVNYGVPADYEQLERLGISVKGAIVIARYGASWRGIKPKVAAEHGAVGCIIYSDPRDDGYYQGQVFPQGAWRPPDGAQRGSVMDMPVYPGDPLTPGAGATANARRLSLSEVQTLTRIPVLPISYADAQPLLAALNGPVAPENWRGALPITYRIGPGPAKVHLKVQSNWDLKPLYNVIATIRGSQFPDEWVIRGNHHDAWVNGAEDPGSGAMVVLEEARALAELRKQGWNPKRTVVYCFWDGEEPGLLGSTEWGEEHSAELLRQAAVYINSDANGRGYLGVGGSHSLEHFISDVARDVDDPEKHISVWERSRLSSIANASADERNEIRGRQDLRIGALGSGSDYTVFIDHLGIPSLNIGFGGEDGGGIYHSIYDDFYWYTHFSDTDFVYGRALAQLGGTAVMRMASADVLPFQFANLATTIRRYVDELQKLATQKREEVEERNRQFEEGVFQATADPRETFVPPPKETLPPYVNFAPLLNATAALTRSAEAYEKAFGSAQSVADPAKLNTQLLQTERMLTDAAGLPRRPWFRHQIYAPGFYTGYGVKTIPGVREALEQKNWTEADEQIGRVARILQNEASLLDSMKTTITAR